MKKGLSAVGAAAVIAMLANTVSAAQGIKEGQWSMTMVIQADGMGEEAAKAMKEMESMPPEQKAMMQQMIGGRHMGASGQGMGMTITSSQCMTNARPVPTRDDQKDCQETHSIKGNTVHFDVVCAHSKSSGDVTYASDSMKGRMTSTQTERGKETTSTIDVRGQYEGPCRPAS
ncbi:MAG: DUF3617 family protein [Candidatus Omnitrophica bacterium]|nr:DUF3617 family protein [Candidatus Omnitrophota bacterium]